MPPKVIFRCDAGDAPEIGTGHIARSKTLASAIVKHGIVKQEDIFFYTRDDEGFNLGKKYLASSGIQFQELSGNKLKANSKSEKDILINTEAKLIFFDRLETTKDIVSNIQKEGIKVVTFDDYGSGRNYVDLAISAIFDDVMAFSAILDVSTAPVAILSEVTASSATADAVPVKLPVTLLIKESVPSCNILKSSLAPNLA